MNKLLGVFLLMFVSNSCFAWSLLGPKDFDECILENMKGVNNDIAARLVANSCREKFKEKEVDNSFKHNWILLDSGDDKKFYYDNSTITRNGKIITFVLAHDFNKIQSLAKEGASSKEKDEFYSIIEKVQLDCGTLTFRSINSDVKSGHMGDGNTLEHLGLDKEEAIKKESIFYKNFCME